MYAGNEMAKQSARGDYYLNQAKASEAVVGIGAADARLGEVTEQLSGLSRAIEALSEVAEKLEARLSPVRRQTGGLTKGSQPASPEPVLCAMADGIRVRRHQIERNAESLHNLLSEIEL